MKLISMTDFVLEEGNPSNTDSQFADKVMAYAHFLKQPLNLSMFVTCDDEGNILIEPAKDDFSFYAHKNLSVQEEFKQYKEKVLFEGFKARITKNGFKAIKDGLELSVSSDSKIIVEDLVYDGIILTESATKQIGL